MISSRHVAAREEIGRAEDLNTSLYNSLSRSSTVHRGDRGRVAPTREIFGTLSEKSRNSREIEFVWQRGTGREIKEKS